MSTRSARAQDVSIATVLGWQVKAATSLLCEAVTTLAKIVALASQVDEIARAEVEKKFKMATAGGKKENAENAEEMNE